jgi:hypothetical protein
MIEKINQHLIHTGLSQTTPDDIANSIGVSAKGLRQKFRDLQKEGKLPSNISQPDGTHWIIRNPGRTHNRNLKPASAVEQKKPSVQPVKSPLPSNSDSLRFTKQQEFLLDNFANASDVLFDLGIITTDSFTGEIGEYVSCRYFDLKKSNRVTRAVDGICSNGYRYQVKAKVVSNSNFNYNITGLRPGEYDYLAVVYFDRLYKPLRILRIPEKKIKKDSFVITNYISDEYQCDLSKCKLSAKVLVAISKFAQAYEQLEEVGIIRSRRIVGDIGEFYACRRLNLTPCNNRNQKGLDAINKEGITFEIKTRRVYQSGRRVSETRRINNLIGKDAEYLIVVTVDRSFRCSGMWIMPMRNIVNPKSAHLGIVNATKGTLNLVPSRISWLVTGEKFKSF